MGQILYGSAATTEAARRLMISTPKVICPQAVPRS